MTQRQAIALLEAILTGTLQGIRDLTLMSVVFITGCRVSAIVRARVGHLETDGVKALPAYDREAGQEAARPLRAYLEPAGIGDDTEGPLFRPMKPDGTGLLRRHVDRNTPWRLVKKYCRTAGIDPDRLGVRGIGIPFAAIGNGASLHEVRGSAGHADIRATELDFVHREEDAEVAARRVHIRATRGQ